MTWSACSAWAGSVPRTGARHERDSMVSNDQPELRDPSEQSRLRSWWFKKDGVIEAGGKTYQMLEARHVKLANWLHRFDQWIHRIHG